MFIKALRGVNQNSIANLLNRFSGTKSAGNRTPKRVHLVRIGLIDQVQSSKERERGIPPRKIYKDIWVDTSRYTGSELRKLRALKGVGPVRKIYNNLKNRTMYEERRARIESRIN